RACRRSPNRHRCPPRPGRPRQLRRPSGQRDDCRIFLVGSAINTLIPAG
ncbi:MAG: phage DNA packaging protein J, partial [Clostridiales bacterium]|nr:phage DNA packaging protein J [Clostridiales bacterium]